MSDFVIATPTVLLQAAFLGLLFAAISAYPVYGALLMLKSRQTVSQYVKEHAHKQGTPTMGGIIIGIGFLVACIFIYVQIESASESGGKPHLAIPLLYLGFAAIGFVDDYVVPRMMKGKRGLGWTQKLLMQIAFATLAAWMLGPSISLVSLAVAVFLILFFSNAYNFADGLDWLAGMLLVAMAAGYLFLAYEASASGAALYLAALVAAAVPFLVLNKPKAKLFMGDVGALPIGAVLGCLVAVIGIPNLAPALRDYSLNAPYLPETAVRVPLGVTIGLVLVSLVMVAELVPVPLQILSVKLRKGKRLFSMTPIHHAYQKKGIRETKVVAGFVLVQVLCSALGIGAAMAMSEPAPVENAVEGR